MVDPRGNCERSVQAFLGPITVIMPHESVYAYGVSGETAADGEECVELRFPCITSKTRERPSPSPTGEETSSHREESVKCDPFASISSLISSLLQRCTTGRPAANMGAEGRECDQQRRVESNAESRAVCPTALASSSPPFGGFFAPGDSADQVKGQDARVLEEAPLTVRRSPPRDAVAVDA